MVLANSLTKQVVPGGSQVVLRWFPVPLAGGDSQVVPGGSPVYRQGTGTTWELPAAEWNQCGLGMTRPRPVGGTEAAVESRGYRGLFEVERSRVSVGGRVVYLPIGPRQGVQVGPVLARLPRDVALVG